MSATDSRSPSQASATLLTEGDLYRYYRLRLSQFDQTARRLAKTEKEHGVPWDYQRTDRCDGCQGTSPSLRCIEVAEPENDDAWELALCQLCRTGIQSLEDAPVRTKQRFLRARTEAVKRYERELGVIDETDLDVKD